MLNVLGAHQIQLEMQNEELRQTQLELDAARARYFDLYDQAPSGYLTVDGPGLIVEGNLTAASLLGIDRSRLVARPFTGFIAAADQDLYTQLCRRLAASATAELCELRLVKHDGTAFWAQLVCTPAQDASGAPIRRIAFHDIHASKLAELILAARARLLEFAFTHTLTETLRATLDEAEALTGSCRGFYHFLEADQTTMSLRACSTHTERAMAQAEGTARHCPVVAAGVWADCIRSGRAVIQQEDAVRPHPQGLPSGLATVRRELVVPVRRGTRIVALLGVGNKVTDYTEPDIHSITVLADLAWDIVEKMRVEEALEKSQRILNETGKVGKVGGWEFNMDTGKQTWTEETYLIHELDPGHEPTLAEGITFYTPASRPIIEQAVRRAIEMGEPFDVELEIITAKGNRRGVKAIGKADPEHRRVYGFFQDITGRNQADDVRNFLARTGSDMVDVPFFAALARYLAQSLNIEFVAIDYLEGDGLNARTLAVWSDGHFADNVTYALKDTPCGVLMGEGGGCFPAGVCEIFPHDPMLRHLRAESYAGVTLWGHTCEPIGRIAVISRKPLANRVRVETTLQLVAERAAGELERLRVEEALKEAEWKFRALFENGPIAVAYHEMIYDAAGNPVDYRFIDANRSYVDKTGVDPRGKTATEAFPGIENDPSDWIGTFGRVARGGEPIRIEQYFQSNGRWYDCVAYQYKPDHFVAAFLEITRRKRAEGLLQASLREKESLLQEIHHRVKNNLQIISSLLRLQAGRIEHPMVKAVLHDMQNRVRSMALIHEHLYRSENLAAVDLATYLTNLCQQLMRALVSAPGTIQLHLDLDPVHLPIDQAIPCGLLVNELVSNALKHAFPDARRGEVRVELRRLDALPGWRLRVADTGVGMPRDFAIDHRTTLGLRLVSDLARQLGGRLEIGVGPGAVFEVICPLSGKRLGDDPDDSKPPT